MGSRPCPALRGGSPDLRVLLVPLAHWLRGHAGSHGTRHEPHRAPRRAHPSARLRPLAPRPCLALRHPASGADSRQSRRRGGVHAIGAGRAPGRGPRTRPVRPGPPSRRSARGDRPARRGRPRHLRRRVQALPRRRPGRPDGAPAHRPAVLDGPDSRCAGRRRRRPVQGPPRSPGAERRAGGAVRVRGGCVTVTILTADCLDVLPTLEPDLFHTVVTSPPYWGLRDYGVPDGVGLEPTLEQHIENLVAVFREVRRVLRPDGTLWLNYGDAYANDGKWGGRTGGKHAAALHGRTGIGRRKVKTGLKPKDLMLLPARVALALQADGWWLRSEIVWAKPNPRPESVRDRPSNAHEKVFLFARSERYFYDAAAVRRPYTFEGARHRTKKRYPDRRGVPPLSSPGNLSDWKPGNGANLRNVWSIATRPFPGNHFATFPTALVEPCIRAGSPAGGQVLDPFGGVGTVGLVAQALGRDATLIELNEDYAEMARQRVAEAAS
ncbi:MAG: hypothetical protein F4112_16045 [Holophagales bacterium]|nr:hypothetical protein [Holophagales bacterium]MYB20848.1 hypothetical protein [Holophagales bacterium]MYH25488.1 hypothetical protein [Holophagales bacterium]MYI34460.1 hypothetical protein [Holophagales bacterium]